MENLFVYGTLMSGELHFSFLKCSRFLSEGKTLKEYCMYNMGYFPVVIDEEVSQIHGEAWRVDEETLEMIDKFEGHKFDRIQVPVVLDKSGTINAWMYVAKEDPVDGILMREGKWR